MLLKVPLLLQLRELQVPIHEQDQESQELVLVKVVDPCSEVNIEEGQSYTQ